MKFTDKAIAYLKHIRPAAPHNTLKVSVQGGGCSGMSYKMEWTNDSARFEQDGVAVAVDSRSWLFLADLEIDYSDGLDGVGFIYSNPKASRTCGCGTSFSV
jgi:iron-sulfur cluster assembly protein